MENLYNLNLLCDFDFSDVMEENIIIKYIINNDIDNIKKKLIKYDINESIVINNYIIYLIHIVVYFGHYEIFKLFLSYNCYINYLEGKYKYSILDIAIIKKHKLIVEYLINEKYFHESINKTKISPIEIALFNSASRDIEIINILLTNPTLNINKLFEYYIYSILLKDEYIIDIILLYIKNKNYIYKNKILELRNKSYINISELLHDIINTRCDINIDFIITLDLDINWIDENNKKYNNHIILKTIDNQLTSILIVLLTNKKNLNINISDIELINYACIKSSEKTIKLMLKYCKEIIDINTSSILKHLINRNMINLINYMNDLFKFDFNKITYINNKLDYPLLHAIKHINYSKVLTKKLLYLGASPNISLNLEIDNIYNYNTPLKAAIDTFHFDTINELINAGADINNCICISNKIFGPPLHYLLKISSNKNKSYDEVVPILTLFITKGVNINWTIRENVLLINKNLISKSYLEIEELLYLNNIESIYSMNVALLSLQLKQIDIHKLLVHYSANIHKNITYKTNIFKLNNNILFSVIKSDNIELIEDFITKYKYDVNQYMILPNKNVYLSSVILALNSSNPVNVLKIFKILINNGLNLDIDIIHLNPLLLSIESNNIDLIRLIINHKPNINMLFSYNNCLLSGFYYIINKLIYNDNIKSNIIIKEICKLEPNVNYIYISTNIIVPNILNNAVEKNNFTIANLILKYMTDIDINWYVVNNSNLLYKPPIIIALIQKNDSLIKLLLKYKPNINIHIPNFISPAIYYAIDNNNYEIIKLLIDLKIDYNFYYKSDIEEIETPIEYAINNSNSLDILELLISSNPNITDKDYVNYIYIGLKKDKYNIISILINKININKDYSDYNKLYKPILHTAIINNCSLNIIKLLLINKADTNLYCYDNNNEYYTPLIYAINNNNIEVIKLLVKYKADLNLYVEYFMYPPLHTSIINHKDDELINTIIDLGADLYYEEYFFDVLELETPIKYAILNNNYNITKIILDKNVYIKDCLYFAIKNLNDSFDNIIKLLLSYKFDPNYIIDNETPIKLALTYNKNNLLNILINNSNIIDTIKTAHQLNYYNDIQDIIWIRIKYLYLIKQYFIINKDNNNIFICLSNNIIKNNILIYL